MANIKSQIKRMAQNNKRRLRNRVHRGNARIAVKNAHAVIEEGAPESKEALMKALSELDRAAGKGVIHKNNASRRKARLVKAYNKMAPAAVETPAAAEPVAAEEPEAKKPARRRTTKAAPKSGAAE